MDKIKDLFNGIKYKRKFNKIKNNYLEALETKIKDKEKIVELQNDLLASINKIDELKEEIKELRKQPTRSIKTSGKKTKIISSCNKKGE